jgi:hypothetical protein
MPKLEEWVPYEGAVEGMQGGDFRKGIKNARLLFTVEHQDPARNEDVEVRLPSDHCRIQQEQELGFVGETITPTGKRRARILTWEGMESYDDFKQPLVPAFATEQRAGEPFARTGPVAVRQPFNAPASSPAVDIDDNTGFNVAPVRYNAEGREPIDRIRDRAGDWFAEALAAGCNVADAAFAVHCASCAFKYRDRKGLKGPEDEDERKAGWYTQMFDHLCGRGPDPRSYRAQHTPYARPESEDSGTQTTLPFTKDTKR